MSDKEASGNESSDEYKCPVDECDYSSDSERGVKIHFGGSHDDEVIDRAYLDDLRRLADELGRAPRLEDVDERGEYSTASYGRRFESWPDALTSAGLDPDTRNADKLEAFLDEIRRLGEELGRTPRSMDLKEHSEYSVGQYGYHFGSWNNALRKAGFETNQETLPSEEALIAEIQRLANELGRVPFHHDMTEHSKYGYRSYFRRFGSWDLSLKAAGFDPYTPKDWVASGEDNVNWRGGQFPYGAGWNTAKKEQVRERDGRRCQSCGRSEKEHLEMFDRKHSVHHIQQARTFEDPDDRNHPDNLVTLCETKECHKTWEVMSPLRPQIADRDD